MISPWGSAHPMTGSHPASLPTLRTVTMCNTGGHHSKGRRPTSLTRAPAYCDTCQGATASSRSYSHDHPNFKGARKCNLTAHPAGSKKRKMPAGSQGPPGKVEVSGKFQFHFKMTIAPLACLGVILLSALLSPYK